MQLPASLAVAQLAPGRDLHPSQREEKALRLWRSSGSFWCIPDVPNTWHLVLSLWGRTPGVVKARNSCQVTSGAVPAAACSVLSPAQLRLLPRPSLGQPLLSQVLQEPACPAGPKHHQLPRVLRAMHFSPKPGPE